MCQSSNAALHRHLHSPDGTVRVRAAVALAWLAPEQADDAVPVLTRSVHLSASLAERRIAALSLGHIGAGARRSASVLRLILSDEALDESLTFAAAVALGRVSRDDPAAAEAVLLPLMARER